MVETARTPHPTPRNLDELRAEASGRTACDLYRDATQTVFGAGPPTARLLVVGKQPGNAEDRAGEPFVGPSGASVSYTHLRAHETDSYLVCRLLLEKKKKKTHHVTLHQTEHRKKQIEQKKYNKI